MAANDSDILRLIELGDIEVRYQDGRSETLSPPELEKRCHFKWQEYFTYQAELTDAKLHTLFKEWLRKEATALGVELTDAMIESSFSIISTNEELENFKQNLLKPRELCLYDMGPFGFGLAAKQKLSQGRTIIFTGQYQCVELNETTLTVENPDYSYRFADFSSNRCEGKYQEGVVYYVNPKKEGNLARFMQNLPLSSQYEETPQDINEGKSPIFLNGINPEEVATENVASSNYIILRGGHTYFLPVVFYLTRDLEAGELIGCQYGQADHWIRSSIKYLALFFKKASEILEQGEKIISHVIPRQDWKRSYAGVSEGQKMLFSSDIFDKMRERKRPLYYFPVEQCSHLNLREIFIEANVFSPEEWGHQEHNTLALYWNEFLKPYDASVTVYLQDPSTALKLPPLPDRIVSKKVIKGETLADNSTLDIVITFSEKSTFEQFKILFMNAIKTLLIKNQQSLIVYNEVTSALILRSVNLLVDEHYELFKKLEAEPREIFEFAKRDANAEAKLSVLSAVPPKHVRASSPIYVGENDKKKASDIDSLRVEEINRQSGLKLTY